MARAIVRRRDARRSVLLAYPNAGHGIGNPLPNLPISDGDPFVGASAAANEIARQAIWPQLLRFVANG
jgi:hypothetical protein